MLCYHKKSKHNLYEQLDYLGLNSYEQRHFCFGGAGSGGTDASGGFGDPPGGSEAESGGTADPSGVAGSKDGLDIDSLSTDPPGMTAEEAEAEAAAMDIAMNIEAYRDALQNFGPISDPLGLSQDPDFVSIDPYPSRKVRRIEEIPRKMNTLALLQDPIRMLPKMDSLVDRETAADLGKNYLEMLTKAGVEAKAEGREGLVEDIQEELDRGLLADYYQNYDLMNTLENVGFKSFGTGYRGQYEARTGQSVTRDQYDPNTITGAGTGERSATISLFNQFALANPNMTAMEAMAAFNATQNPDAQVSAVDLGMLGYDPNALAAPQAQANEDERYRGFIQGLGLIGKGVALGPVSVAADIALSGKTGEESILGILTDELDKQTGIPTAVGDFYDQFKTDLGKARDTVVDAVQENIVDPVTGFFSPEPEAPAQTPDYTGVEMAFLDPIEDIPAYTSPYAGLSTPEFEAQMAFEEYQRGIDFDKERDIPGLEVDVQQVPGSLDNMISSLPPSSPEDDALADAYNFAALSPLSPEQDPDFKKGSFFEGLDPKETQDYIDRVTTPEGVKLVRKTRAPAPRPPTVSEQVSAPRTGNFFPGSFGRPTATPRTRTQTIADIYGLSEEDADRMLGIA